MKRRQVLGTAGAIAGASLAGCGGGGDDLGVDSTGEIAAYTIPRNLVPTSAKQYQVEVVFQSKRAVTVAIVNGLTAVNIASKGVTSGSSHKVGWAKFRCTTEAGKTNADFSLRITDGEFRTTVAGTSNTTPDDYRQYLTHSDGATEYEWNFYDRTDKEHLVSVRFFPIDNSEYITFNSGEYVRPIANTATHANGGGLDRLLPKHHATTLQIINHEAAVILSAADNKDTVCLPNNRRESHDELVPSYLAASAAEKPLLKRRLLRHIDRHARRTRNTNPMDTQDDDEVYHLLGNEIVRTLGGASLIRHLNDLRDNVRTSIQNNLDQMGSAFDTFCTNQLPALSSQAMIDGTRDLLEVADSGEADSKVGGGCGVTTSLQFNVNVTQTDYPWPGIDLGGGVRISLGLARAARKWENGQKEFATYNIGEIATKGTKLGFTFILKGFNGSSLKINGVSADVEVSLNFTVRDDKWRLEQIQFDPVFDVDTRTWLGKMVSKGLARLLAPAVGGTQGIAALPAALSYGTPTWTTGLGPEMGVIAGRLYNSGAQLVNAGIKNYMNPALQKFRDVLDGAGAGTRTWGTFEMSALRIVIPNSDVNDTSIPFRGGFQYGGIGWQPGVKYIAGFGAAPSYTVPYVAPGTTAPPGTVTFGGFIRVVAVADVYAIYGSSNFIRSMSFPWDF